MDDRFEIIRRNSELARRINDELLRDPNHPYTGKWIGIANGQVIAVADSWDGAKKRLVETESDSFRTLIMEGVGETEEEINAIYGA